jgi:hypothetical protein
MTVDIAEETQELDQDLPQEDKLDELALLKQRARMMGVEFSPNIGLAKLRERINAKMAGEALPQEAEAKAEVNPLVEAPAKGPEPKKITLRQHLYNTQMKLIRLRITNLDPKKKDLPGEIVTVANEHLGTIRKYVPYGEVTDDGYHVPYCIYRELDSRKFLNIRVVRGRNDQQVRVESVWAKEFALEILPPLTKEQLRQLATAQQAAGGMSD